MEYEQAVLKKLMKQGLSEEEANVELAKIVKGVEKLPKTKNNKKMEEKEVVEEVDTVEEAE